MQAPPRSGQPQHYSPFLGHPWRTVVKDNLPRGHYFGQCTWLLTLLGRRNGQTWDYIPIHGLWPMVWLDGQELRKCLENCSQGNLGKRYVERPLQMGKTKKNMKIVMSHAKQSRILIMKWIGWLALWIPISLFPQPRRHCPMGSWTKRPWWQGWRLCIGSASYISTHQDWPVIATVECPICLQQRITLITQKSTISWGYQPATWWQVNYIVRLPLWKGHCFVPTGIDIYSRDGFAFPACNTSDKTMIHGFTECLIHQHGITYSIACDQGTHITAKEVWQEAHAHGIHGFYHIPHRPTVTVTW